MRDAFHTLLDVVLLGTLVLYFFGLVPPGWKPYHVMLALGLGASVGGLIRALTITREP